MMTHEKPAALMALIQYYSTALCGRPPEMNCDFVAAAIHKLAAEIIIEATKEGE